MAFGDWVVAAVIRFNTNGTTVMERLAASTKIANAELAHQQGLITKNELAMMRYHQRLERLQSLHLKVFTAVSGGIAAGGFATAGYAIKQAADLQKILIGIQNVSGANAQQMEGFYRLSFGLGAKFGTSPQDAAELLRTTVRMSVGQLSIAQMQKVAPDVAQFAMLMHQNRGISTDDGAKVGIGLAHMFRAYQPAALHKLLDMNLRLSEMMGEGPDQAMRQMAYYVPLFKSIGVSDDASLATMALLDRAGFRNKVGTNVRALVLDALGPLQLTQHAQSGKMGLLQQMGIFNSAGKFAFYDKNGKYDMFGMLGQLNKWELNEKKHGMPDGEIAKVLYSVFGKQGGTIAALFSDPQMTAFLKSIRSKLNDPNISMDAQSRGTQKGLGYQFQTSVNNLNAVMTELGYPWLDDLTKFFKAVADKTHGIQEWLHGHRDAEKSIGLVFANLMALSTGSFVIGSAAMLRTSLAMPGAVLRMSASLDALTANIGANAAAMAGEEAAVGAGSVAAVSGLTRLAGALRLLGPAICIALGGALLTDGGYGQDEARQALVKRYGYDYWRYLKSRHKGENPYSFDRSQGDMSPDEWAAWHKRVPNPNIDVRRLRPQRGAKGFDYTNHRLQLGAPATQVTIQNVEFKLPPGTPAQQGAAATKHFISTVGSYATTHGLPTPESVGLGPHR